MNRILYDLAAADDRIRFSPYCWRIRMALAHKGLACETVPWRFTDKSAIAFAKTDRVPVLVDGEVVVTDSMVIADYLDANYPDHPLLGDAPSRAHAMFVRHWTESILFPQITRQIIGELVHQLHEKDRDYFRRTREARLGQSLEEFSKRREASLPELYAALQPLRLLLPQQPFIGGEQPSFADYIVFAALQWARCGVGRILVHEGDPVYAWFDRLLHMYDGLGAKAHCAGLPEHTRTSS